MLGRVKVWARAFLKKSKTSAMETESVAEIQKCPTKQPDACSNNHENPAEQSNAIQEISSAEASNLTTCMSGNQHSNMAPSNAHRQNNQSAEAQLALFMDKYLYERFPTGDLFSSIKRVYDAKEQMKGIDVQLVGKDGRVYNVDEKAQIHYLNKHLPTFAFELLSYQKGHDTIGWLCNEKLETEFYMLIWPSAKTNDYNGIAWSHFTNAKCLLIRRKRLLATLEGYGMTSERMMCDARRIRLSGQHGKIPICGTNDIYYYASYPQKYQEAPINIVVREKVLVAIAQQGYLVSPEEVTVLKKKKANLYSQENG